MRQYMLVTERMYLALAHPKYAKEVSDFNIRNREPLRETEPVRPEMFYTKSGVKKYLKEDYKDAMKGIEYRYYMKLKGEDKIIGTVCISQITYGSVLSCTLSYKLDREYWGKGLATEAVKEIISFAFNILRLHRIEALVMPKNERSLNIMEKLNFENEGLSKKCLEVNKEWTDHYRFALLNDKIKPTLSYNY